MYLICVSAIAQGLIGLKRAILTESTESLTKYVTYPGLVTFTQKDVQNVESDQRLSPSFLCIDYIRYTCAGTQDIL